MMINEMKNSRSSDLLPMFYDCKYFLFKDDVMSRYLKIYTKTNLLVGSRPLLILTV